MNYYMLLAFAFILGFLVTEIVKRFVLKRKIVVHINHKDGSVSKHLIYAGKDPEVDQLLSEAKEKKQRAV